MKTLLEQARQALRFAVYAGCEPDAMQRTFRRALRRGARIGRASKAEDAPRTVAHEAVRAHAVSAAKFARRARAGHVSAIYADAAYEAAMAAAHQAGFYSPAEADTRRRSAMKKEEALRLFGGVVKTAAAIGASPQAVSRWPDKLSPRIVDRIIAALVRAGRVDEAVQLAQDTRGAGV